MSWFLHLLRRRGAGGSIGSSASHEGVGRTRVDRRRDGADIVSAVNCWFSRSSSRLIAVAIASMTMRWPAAFT